MVQVNITDELSVVGFSLKLSIFRNRQYSFAKVKCDNHFKLLSYLLERNNPRSTHT